MEISKSIIIPAKLDAVFAAIAGGALFKATEVVDGTLKVNFHKNGDYSFSWPEAGKCRGIFKEIIPGEKVIFTWVKSEAVYSKEPMETEVEINLRKVTEGTEMRLSHVGFNMVEAYNSHNEGWGYVMEEFARQLAN